ncbi:TylF/MycF/NovP-related O-methyltransferase [Amycolatopsis pithecellobii]|uniref:Class I SAM-dependent methyltransferase n=1 Tax=Amycolatopsis pithecellobii TaxID=664692 RepID=A0A6N7Z3D5_9PSEU|nr:TylF/MycF/NovP-related O-methyltransferase [Amycolatopsis pithecellobii]MTD53416.1 class I SAM-dependent methyltransferase [Amycolatopsis pithecellobii]
MFDRLRAGLRAKLVRIADETADRQYARYEALVEGLRRELREETARLADTVREIEFRSRRDIHAAGERAAVASTDRFVRAHLPTVVTFPHPMETLQHALSFVPDTGMVCEFGVFGGTTLKAITAALPGREIYGFDSFEGLPEDWRTNIPSGAFDRGGQRPEVDGAVLVVGWFADTLPGFVEEQQGPVAFLHLDADLYSSTATVLEHLGDRLRPGSVVLFDEYFNYPGWEEHEHKAWQEFVARTGITFEYLCYTSNNEQLALRIT